MKKLILLSLTIFVLLLGACIPVPATNITDDYNKVILTSDQQNADFNAKYTVPQFLLSPLARCEGDRIYSPPVYYTAGFSFKNLDENIILGIITLLLGFFIGAALWQKIGGISAKVGAGIETAAQAGYKSATMLNSLGMASASVLIKEGSEVADELGDVATVLANATADGKFNVEDAKAVLKEGKEVVVAMKDFLLVVKPKTTE